MRKHIDYFYKSYDKEDVGVDCIINERFNEYGYNFAGNSRKIVDKDVLFSKTNYRKCQKIVAENKKK